MKKIKAFSLIELLISLIIISVIIASFAPVMTKRLSKTSITLGSGDSAITNECSAFGDNCKLCNKDECLFCDANCLSNQYKDAINCKCVDCAQTFGAECKACSALSCTVCSDFFEVSGTGCAFLSCPDGTYLSGSTCPACTAFHLKCSKCNATEGCTECATGYIAVNGKCNKKVTQTDCTSKFDGFWDGFNGICVTKRNMGYSANGSSTEKYKEIPIPTEAGVSSVKVTTKCPKSTTDTDPRCCWFGTTGDAGVHTASSASDLTAKNGSVAVSPAYTYSTYKRTVCNWYAAKAICSTYNGGGAVGYWRLPKKEELDVWSSNLTSITKGLGQNGLQLCDGDVSNQGAPRCDWRQDQCKYNNVNFSCGPYFVWGESVDSYGSPYKAKFSSGTLEVSTIHYTYFGLKTGGFSTRCVIDNFPSD